MPNQAVIKNLPANAGDMDSIPGLGRSPGVWNGNPFQYSCLENTMDRGAWLGCSPWSQSWTWLSTHTCIIRKSKQSASKQVWSLWWWKMSNWQSDWHAGNTFPAVVPGGTQMKGTHGMKAPPQEEPLTAFSQQPWPKSCPGAHGSWKPGDSHTVHSRKPQSELLSPPGSGVTGPPELPYVVEQLS